jgi:hypothetical protein
MKLQPSEEANAVMCPVGPISILYGFLHRQVFLFYISRIYRSVCPAYQDDVAAVTESYGLLPGTATAKDCVGLFRFPTTKKGSFYSNISTLYNSLQLSFRSGGFVV